MSAAVRVTTSAVCGASVVARLNVPFRVAGLAVVGASVVVRTADLTTVARLVVVGASVVARVNVPVRVATSAVVGASVVVRFVAEEVWAAHVKAALMSVAPPAKSRPVSDASTPSPHQARRPSATWAFCIVAPAE